LRRPGGALAEHIQQLWFYDGYVKPHARERLLPDGSMELVINLSEDETRVWNRRDLSRYDRLEGAALIGPQSGYFVIDTAEQRTVMGVHFRPGGAFPFLPLPADELHGQHVSLSDLWGSFAREVRERLLATEDVAARFDLLEGALMSQMNPMGRHPAVRFALREFDAKTGRRVADVTEAAGLSARRFIELFRREVGMPPKTYCRVRRFQRTVRRAAIGGPLDWRGEALASGYFDQAHLIHDFQAIAGISPGTWAELRTEHFNHVPLK